MKPFFTSLLLLLTTWSAAQSTTVQTEEIGSRSMASINAQQLHDELTVLLAAQNLTATDVSALTAAFNGLPPIPTALSDLTNDVGYTTFDGDYSSLTNAPTSVTAFSDVSDAGSGAIITATERTLLASLSNALALIDSMSAELTLLQTANNLSFTCGGLYYFNGHAYETVEIGTQCWFAENLRTTHYANGDAIPVDLSAVEWSNTTSGAQTTYGEGSSTCQTEPCDEAANLEDFGRLYNWYAVNDARGVCPSGWHVPTDGEYMTLEMELGMTSSQANATLFRGSDQGAQMKVTASDSPTWDGTNSSGFAGLPGGYRASFGDFDFVGSRAYFWSSSPFGFSAMGRQLQSGYLAVYRGNFDLHTGFSVRCIRD